MTSVGSDSILAVSGGEGQWVVGKDDRYFGFKFIPVPPGVCEGLVQHLGAASGLCHDLRDHLVPSL